MTYRLKAAIEATRPVPGGEYTTRLPLLGTGPGSALSTGVVGIPAGALSGASFGVPMGDVVSPGAVLLQNGQQDLNVRLNGATAPLRLGAGGVLLLEQQAGSESDQLSSISVSTVTAQTQAGALTFVIAGQAEPAERDALYFISNGFFAPPTLDSASVETYSSAMTTVALYTGAPWRKLQLARTDPSGDGDRGHSVCPVPGYFLVTATERVGEDNFGESLYVIPSSLSGELPLGAVRRITAMDIWGPSPPQPPGMRFVARMADNTVIFGASNFVRVPLEALLDFGSDLSGYPRWSASTTMGFDCVPDPRNPNWLWIETDSQFFAFDFAQPEGALSPVRFASGSNIGLAGWGGGLAFGPDNYLWKPLMHLNTLGAWSPEQQDALPATAGGVNGNPVPARTLSSPAFDFDHETEQGLYRVCFDATGCWVSTYQYANDPTDPARAYHFTNAQMAAGGSQMPDAMCDVTISHPLGMRAASGPIR